MFGWDFLLSDINSIIITQSMYIEYLCYSYPGRKDKKSKKKTLLPRGESLASVLIA